MRGLDGIDVFVKVIQSGSFSAAARGLGMPVTTVSGKVAALEKRLGVTLIHRTARKLNVTREGEAYFQHCVRALDEISAGEKELFTKKAEPEGLLRITAPNDFGHLLLPTLVSAYLKAYPKTQVELVLTNRVVDLVAEDIDLAFRAGPLKDSSLVARKFMDSGAHLYASSAYVKKEGLPKHPQDLSERAFVAMKFFGNNLKLNREKSNLNIPVHPRIIVDDLEAVKAFVMNGDGIGIILPMLCEAEEAAGKIVRVLPAWTLDLGTGNVSFVYPPQRFVAPKVQAFIELASKTCSAERVRK